VKPRLGAIVNDNVKKQPKKKKKKELDERKIVI